MVNKNDIITTFKLTDAGSYKRFIEIAESKNVFKACGNMDNMWVMCRFKDKEHVKNFIDAL